MRSATTLPVIVSNNGGVQTGAATPDGQQAVKISVTYQTIGVIPIPGILESKATFYRTVWMRLRG